MVKIFSTNQIASFLKVLYLKKVLRDQVDCFHIEKDEILRLVNVTLFGGSCKTCPKTTKEKGGYTSAISQKTDAGTTWNSE